MTNTDATLQSALTLLEELGWRVTDCQSEVFGPGGTLGRETRGDVVLVDRLLPVLRRLNPLASESSLSLAVDELVRDRGSMDLIVANREVHLLLLDGFRRIDPGESPAGDSEQAVRYIDWDHPEANDLLVARAFEVTGEMSTCRCGLVGFVNGIPLAVLEVGSAHRDLERAFEATVVEYERAVPQLFWYNAFSVLSNGIESRVGPVGAAWEHFGTWKRAVTEEEAPRRSLERAIRGTCERSRLLDLVESAFLFVAAAGGPVKMMAKNHQHLGVGSALEALRDRAVNENGLGMFWHAPGSGKGVSLILFVQRVLRKMPGAWTFVVVTDRQEKEDQVYGRLAAAGLVKSRVRPENAKELGRVLHGRGRFVFMPIHRFAGEGSGGQYPLVSERSDVVVMEVEAHRPEYDPLAANMRRALPEAAFIGFTSSPFSAGEDDHRRVFGDYVSIYNFRESVEDGITVPVYYENRLPEVQLDGIVLDRGLERILREAELAEAREARLEAESGRRYYAITDDERLDTVARDIVKHFTERGYPGKALMVSIDRITAARMYEKVRSYWALQLAGLRLQVGSAAELDSEGDLGDPASAGGYLAYWEKTDMALVLPKSMDDVEEFHRRGVDVVPHLERAAQENLIAKFNDPEDPLRLVFTCANWIHGVDVPPCSTIYLDKPMRDHTVVQTVARAGRVFQRKTSGHVVDYLGVFQDPRKVLAAYGAGSGAGVAPGDLPVAAKTRQVKELRRALSSLADFVRSAGFELDTIKRTAQLPKLRLVDEAIDAVLATDASKEGFLARAKEALLLYRAILPDPAADELSAECALYAFMLKRIRMLTSQPGLSPLEARLVRLLDASIEARGYGLKPPEVSASEPGRTTGVRKLSPDDVGLFGPGPVDFGRIDPETVWKRFPHAQKNIEIERLRGALDKKLAEMVRLNPSRAGLREKLAGFVREPGGEDIGSDALFARLIDLVQEVNAESGRPAQEGLREEELALVDLLMQAEPVPGLGQGELVKTAIRELVAALKADLLVAGWRKDRQSRAAVRSRIEETVEKLLDLPSAAELAQKTDLLFQHVYDSYPGGDSGVYAKG